MRIRYLPFRAEMASARLRHYIPGAVLAKRGHKVAVQGDADVVILSKHGWGDEWATKARRVVFDVCDDHFEDEHAAHYRKWLARADVVTCNSAWMAKRIAEFGRDAIVIDDPYESDERAPRCHAPALWFGHAGNLFDLDPIYDKLPEMRVVSNLEALDVIQWSPDAMKKAWDECGLVVLPTGPRKGKSANRAVESIRNGLYPCCGRLPAYEELGLGTDDVPREAWECLKHPKDTKGMVAALQDRVRDRFSPETVADAWERAIA